MDSLAFNVAQLLKEPAGATRQGEVWADLNRLIPDLQTEASPAAPSVSGPVRLMHTTEGVLVQGSLDASLVLPCIRCLEPVSVAMEVCLEETFAPTVDIVTGRPVVPEEEDHALWIDSHHVLDVGEVLRQDVLVSLPLQVLCREECLGLCAQCGQNLNEAKCDCQPEADPRWSALVDLLDKP